VKRIITLAAGAIVATVGALLTITGGLTTAIGSAQTSGLPTVTIAMDGKSITVGGTLQSGAVDIASTNTTKKAGEPLLVRLNPGVTPDQVYAFLSSKAAKDPNNASRFGSIVFDSSAPRGTSDVQTSLQPGQYVALDARGNHPAKFPHTAFSIAQAAQPAALPTPKATVKAIEFDFRAPHKLHSGELVRFENGGFLVHMIDAIRAKDQNAAKQLAKFLREGKTGKAFHLAQGDTFFLGPASTGAVQQEAVKAKPGVYVLACFMDTQDGREHTQLGMERIIRIAH
jgi:hypothetical protein